MSKTNRLKDVRAAMKAAAVEGYGVKGHEIGLDTGYTGTFKKIATIYSPKGMPVLESIFWTREEILREDATCLDRQIDELRFDFQRPSLALSVWNNLMIERGQEPDPFIPDPPYVHYHEEFDGGRPEVPFARIYAANTNEMIEDSDVHGLRERLGITPAVLAVRDMGKRLNDYAKMFPDIVVETAPNFYGAVEHDAFMVAGADHETLGTFLRGFDWNPLS